VIDLVIFDFDGTLAESEVLAAEIESQMFAELKVTLSPKEITTIFSGVSPASMRKTINETYNVELPPDFFARFEEAFFKQAPGRLETTPGARQVLKTLKTPYCLASNSSHLWLEKNLAAVDLSHFFKDRVYPASLVDKGKPAPDLFHYISRLHEVAPERSIVIEDSLSGVGAARAAGMNCIGYVGGQHCSPDHGDALTQAGANFILSDLEDLVSENGKLHPKYWNANT
jgi:HAD superfamily hydrolase (TIGR01509 family)